MCGIAAILCDYEHQSTLSSFLWPVLNRRGPDIQGHHQCLSTNIQHPKSTPLCPLLLGAVLHLRGTEGNPTKQPHVCLETGNVLCWNGEVFDGAIKIGEGTNDTIEILKALNHVTANVISTTMANNNLISCIAERIRVLLLGIQGPFAFHFWCASIQTLFYGRDPIGKRSLLKTVSHHNHGIFMLSSVAPQFGLFLDEKLEWSEISSSFLFSVKYSDIASVSSASSSSSISSQKFEHQKYPWMKNQDVIRFDLTPSLSYMAGSIQHFPDMFHCAKLNKNHEYHQQQHQTNSLHVAKTFDEAVGMLFTELDAAVRKRVVDIPTSLPSSVMFSSSSPSQPTIANAALLFSGGIDSVVLACFMHRHIPSHEIIELVNVCFYDDTGDTSKPGGKKGKQTYKTKNQNCHQTKISKEVIAPDRLAAFTALLELEQLYPTRVWNLLCIDVGWNEVKQNRQYIASLSSPNITNMDVNIAIALWFASRGIGEIISNDEIHQYLSQTISENDENKKNELLRYNMIPTTQLSSSSSSSTTTTTVPEVKPCQNDMNQKQQGSCGNKKCLGIAKKNCKFNACGSCCRRTYKFVSQIFQSQEMTNETNKTVALIPNQEEIAHTVHEEEDMASEKLRRKRARKDFRLDVPSLFQQLNQEGLCGTCENIDQLRKLFHPQLEEENGQFICPCAAHPSPKVYPINKSSLSSSRIESHANQQLEHSKNTAAEEEEEDTINVGVLSTKKLYQLKTRVLISGCGADELMGGYARYRGVFQRGGNEKLREELDNEMFNMQHRNLGRDDRVISDWGRELRCPFLDENVIFMLRMRIPIEFICNLNDQSGIGDKKILRHLASQYLGLSKSQGGCASLVKRAIQFGSRIAKLSNYDEYGSNRKGKGQDQFPVAP